MAEPDGVVAVFLDLAMAYLARSVLEASGIPCRLTNEYTVGVHPLYANALHGIELRVPCSYLEAARELLTHEQFPPDPDPEDGSSCSEDTGGDNAYCPRCGRPGAAGIKLNKVLLLLTWLSGGVIPLKTRAAVRRCRLCGHTWRTPFPEEQE